MKVLVVGNGGREQALAWKLLQSPAVKKVFCVPGNGGTASLSGCENLDLKMTDFEAIAQVALSEQVALVVVGPELPLSLGITDYLQQYNLAVFGPKQAGAAIEASKSWSKALMVAAGVPTAEGMTFTDPQSAKSYIEEQGAPIVVKADGLAAGKGVIVATNTVEAIAAVDTLFAQNFQKVVVEEFLAGEEVSVLAITDGFTIRPLLPAQDHKRIGEGDQGQNTGGMGAYAPAPILTPDLQAQVTKTILEPTLAALRQQGIDYCGVLYAGLMVTPKQELKVLEFNCRFGDPETQAILPLLATPLEEVLLACTQQRLSQLPPLAWHPGAAVCVVMAAGGYPGSYQSGMVITGISEAEATGALVFQAGTQWQGSELLTAGGRVLGVTAVGENFATAINKAYQAVDCIDFDGKYYRRDIGQRVYNR